MKKIILLSGDPNSINSELIYKSWKKIPISLKKRIYLITNYNLIKKQLKALRYRVSLLKVKNINVNSSSQSLKVIDIKLKFKNPFKVSRRSASKFVLDSLNFAHNQALKNDVAGIINCAIDKKLLNKKKTGVTEYLASKCKIKNSSESMLIANDKFAVSPITTHLDIKDVAKNLSKNKIVLKIMTINKWFKKLIKRNPKIGILGLNPHNAELIKGSEHS